MTEYIYNTCIALYEKCSQYASKKGLIVADTKLEFGFNAKNEIVLADEIFTPDSSRFWDSSDYLIGTTPRSFDKQLIRDWLSENKEQGQYQYEKIPHDLIIKTEKIYEDCYRRLMFR